MVHVLPHALMELILCWRVGACRTDVSFEPNVDVCRLARRSRVEAACSVHDACICVDFMLSLSTLTASDIAFQTSA